MSVLTAAQQKLENTIALTIGDTIAPNSIRILGFERPAAGYIPHSGWEFR